MIKTPANQNVIYHSCKRSPLQGNIRSNRHQLINRSINPFRMHRSCIQDATVYRVGRILGQEYLKDIFFSESHQISLLPNCIFFKHRSIKKCWVSKHCGSDISEDVIWKTLILNFVLIETCYCRVLSCQCTNSNRKWCSFLLW